MIIKIKLFLLLIFLIVGSILLLYKGGVIMRHSNLAIGPAEALEIAKQYALKAKYNESDLIVEIDPDNKIWEKYYIDVTQGSNSLLTRISYSIYNIWCNWIKSKDYYAIYCRTKKIMFGGGMWILVDKKSGSIIWKIRTQ